MLRSHAMIAFIAFLLINLWSTPPAQAYVFSSTYEPQLYVTLDDKPAGLNVVVRAHQDNTPASADDIFPCDRGRCFFSNNHHKVESQWHYYIERLNKKIPVESKDKPKARAKFYQENAKVNYSQEVTSSIQSFDFTPHEQKNDYTLKLNTETNTAKADTVYQGDYIPGEDGLDVGGFNVPPDFIRLGIFACVIIIIYVSFKFFPIGHH